MADSILGSCGDKFLTFTKGFDADGCAIVTFEAPVKPGCCDVEANRCVIPLQSIKAIRDNADGTYTPITSSGEEGEDVIQTTTWEYDDAGDMVITEGYSQDQETICLNPLKAFEQDPETGVITATDQDDEKFFAETKYSTTEVNAGAGVVTITTDDDNTSVLCTNPIKDVRQNDDGSWSAIRQDNTVALSWSDTTVPADGSAVFGMVDAEGNTMDLNGGVLSPALDGQGNPIPPNTPVLNIFDGQGNYLGSKVCDTDTTVMVQTPNGVVRPTDAATGHQIVTQCCTWTSVVDDEGNITAPDGTVAPAVDTQGNPIPTGTEVQSETDVDGVYVSSCPKAFDGGSNLILSNGQVGPLLRHGDDAAIDVTNAKFLTQFNLVSAFTDGCSDAENPDCRTEVVCGEDGKLYTQAPHRCYRVGYDEALGRDFISVDTPIPNGSTGNSYIPEYDQSFRITNPDPCRPVILSLQGNMSDLNWNLIDVPAGGLEQGELIARLRFDIGNQNFFNQDSQCLRVFDNEGTPKFCVGGLGGQAGYVKIDKGGSVDVRVRVDVRTPGGTGTDGFFEQNAEAQTLRMWGIMVTCNNDEPNAAQEMIKL